MTFELTLSIIKPDAVEQSRIGSILARLEEGGMGVAAIKMLRMSHKQFEAMYGEHAGQPYYADMMQYMTSGPAVFVVLAGEGAINRNRAVMGNTNPALAAPGTLRADFGTAGPQGAGACLRNAVHGSDSAESARREIAFFFERGEIYGA
ncbi:MAG: nucleoside-diphosphate kinase [Gammaproteobacteria bacterium]